MEGGWIHSFWTPVLDGEPAAKIFSQSLYPPGKKPRGFTASLLRVGWVCLEAAMNVKSR